MIIPEKHTQYNHLIKKHKSHCFRKCRAPYAMQAKYHYEKLN